MDEATRKAIQRIAARTLQDAGLAEPPLSVERLLEPVNLYRDYYDLWDPGFLDHAKHKLKIHGRRLVEIVNKVRLRAVLLFDENRICIDNDLPRIKRPWASCHETAHRILAMAMLVSTPGWCPPPADQEHRWRYFGQSPRFQRLFPGLSETRIVITSSSASMA